MQFISHRRARRTAKLRELVASWPGGASGLASVSGTPKSHISAILAGRRGVGDDLAAKFERLADKPPGWLDESENDIVLTAAERALVLAFRAQMAALHSPLPALPPAAEPASPQARKPASPQARKPASPQRGLEEAKWDAWVKQQGSGAKEPTKRQKKDGH